jgi:hypothetical protein
VNEGNEGEGVWLMDFIYISYIYLIYFIYMNRAKKPFEIALSEVGRRSSRVHLANVQYKLT